MPAVTSETTKKHARIKYDGYMDLGGDSPPSLTPGGGAEDIIGSTGVIHVSPGENDTSNNFGLSN